MDMDVRWPIAGIGIFCTIISFMTSNFTLGIVIFTAIFSVFVFFYNRRKNLKVELIGPFGPDKVRKIVAINTGMIPIPLDRGDVGVLDNDRKGRMAFGNVHPESEKTRKILNPGERTEAINFQDSMLISNFQAKDNTGEFTIYGFILDQQGKEYRSEQSYTLLVPKKDGNPQDKKIE